MESSSSEKKRQLEIIKREIEDLKKSLRDKTSDKTSNKTSKTSNKSKTRKNRTKKSSQKSRKSYSSIEVHPRDLPSLASYNSHSTSHDLVSILDMNEEKERLRDIDFSKYETVDVRSINLEGNDFINIRDLKSLVSNNSEYISNIEINTLIRDLTTSDIWKIEGGILSNIMIGLLYLIIKHKNTSCFPERKNILNILKYPLERAKYNYLEFKKVIIRTKPGKDSPMTSNGFSQLLNTIMNDAEYYEPEIFPLGFFDKPREDGYTYREKITLYFKGSDSTILSYTQVEMEFISNRLNIPLIPMMRFGNLLNELTTTKLFFDGSYLKKYIAKCLKGKKNFIILFLKLPEHANCIIIDKVRREIERFEPNGGNEYDHNDLFIDNELQNLFITGEDPLLGREYRYLTPNDYCPDGFQSLRGDIGTNDPDGFCFWWTLFYIDMRLSNPSLSREILIQTAIRIMNNTLNIVENSLTIDFNKFARSYAVFISVAELYLKNILENEAIDDYGILMTSAMENFIKKVL